ncbi:MAG: biotin attachment protein [Phycisphaerae bacterium]|nr:biotin attachment protein [Gemmatimonadaceae bacterium]
MKYVVELNGERMLVELDGATATVDGETFTVGLQAIPGTPVRLVRIGEAMHRVTSRRQPANGRGAFVMDVDGFRHEVLALDERTRAIRDLSAKSEAASGPAPLKAPMPGLVVRIAVAVGDLVSAGQALVVVEAMKMENELRAAAPGVVTAIKAVEGTAVEKGALLVELGPVPDAG